MLDCFRLNGTLRSVFNQYQQPPLPPPQAKRHLRKMGAVAGRIPKSALTSAQEAQLRELYADLMARADRFEAIAEQMGGDFTARKVRYFREVGWAVRLYL